MGDRIAALTPRRPDVQRAVALNLDNKLFAQMIQGDRIERDMAGFRACV